MSGEWYHCYNRGVDKRRVFECEGDYARFMEALYLCNSDEPMHQDNLRRFSHKELFLQKRGKPLVAIAAYCLMPNHFHLLLEQVADGGITAFMRKVGTSYTMYFNIKNERVGNLFVKPFRSQIVSTDAHFMHIPHYLHLNPAELFAPDWKRGKVQNASLLTQKLENYPYSSLCDYGAIKRPERSILDQGAMSLFGKEYPNVSKLVSESLEYYSRLAM